MTNPLTPEELAAIRERFEAWLLADGWHGEEHLRKTPSDNYDSPSVGVAWRAWQAAYIAALDATEADKKKCYVEAHDRNG